MAQKGKPLVVNVGNINDWKSNVSAVVGATTSNLGTILSGQIPSIVIQEARDASADAPRQAAKGDRFRIVWNSRTLYALIALVVVVLLLSVLLVLAWSDPAREQALFDRLLTFLGVCVVALVTILVGKSIPGLSDVFKSWS